MSGLFGVIDSRGVCRTDSLLKDMGKAMFHRDWYTLDLFSEESYGLGIGKIGIGLFNSDKQPAFSLDGNLICYFCGELSNSGALLNKADEGAESGKEISDAAIVLELFRKKGELFIGDIEGKFVLAVWDRLNRQFLVANDILGQYPLLYSHFKGRLIFAPEMKGILCDPEFKKDIDRIAMAEYMRFQSVLGERSFFKGITFLPGASVLRYNQRTDELRISAYWDFSEIKEERASFMDVVDESGRLLKQALDRIHSKPFRPGFFLSGGLDSRVLVSLMEKDHYPLTTISYGRKHSRDVIYAHEISRKLSSRHHFFNLDHGTWIENSSDFHLEVTEGYQSWIHGRDIEMMKRMRQFCDVGILGFGSSAVFAQTVPVCAQKPLDESDFFRHVCEFFTSKHTWPSLSEAEEASLFTDSTYEKIRGLALSSLALETSKYKDLPFSLRAGILRIRNTQIKFFYQFLLFYGTHFEVNLPFYDYRVLKFGLGLPLWMKMGKKIFRTLINRHAPRLARVPNQKDGLIIADDRFHKYPQFLFRRVTDRFNRHVFPFFPQYSSLDIDIENYLRGDLKEWGEAILFDRRTQERGIFNPEFLRSIWERHQSGDELHTIGKIAPIMTYEMMLRRFYD